MEEVTSIIKKEETTFRFRLVKEDASLDMADAYLISWLFTERDERGSYFQLESLLDNKKESEAVKKEKAEEFEAHNDKWSGLVKGREGYQRLRYPFKGFSLLSIPMIIFSFGLFYYFATIDPISWTQQWVMVTIFGVLSVATLFFNRNKWALSIYYATAIIMTLAGFSLVKPIILTSILYFIAWLIQLFLPSFYRSKELKKLTYAMKTARALFKQKQYPIGADPAKIENRIMYAILLGAGEAYGEQCGKEQIEKLNAYYPLLNNPVYATSAFNTTNLALYATVVQSSSTSTTTSTTGGGGAGAF